MWNFPLKPQERLQLRDRSQHHAAPDQESLNGAGGPEMTTCLGNTHILHIYEEVG